MEVLLQPASNDLLKWLDFLCLKGAVSAACLESIVWPRRLKQLVVETDLALAVETVSWPTSLQLMGFGGCFNQPIAGVAWPASLRRRATREGVDLLSLLSRDISMASTLLRVRTGFT